MANPIAFMTANFVARETGYAIDGWAHGDRTTQEAFAPLETYAERFDALLADVRALGFDTIDLWGAHLAPRLGDGRARRGGARGARAARPHASRRTRRGSSPANVERACEMTLALGTTSIGGGFSGDPAAIAPGAREHGVRLGIENHPGADAGGGAREDRRAATGMFGATVDTGWWGRTATTPRARSRSSASTSCTCT